MNIDTGLAVVIIAVLVFYLRLILLQRERVKQVRRESEAKVAGQNRGKKSIASPQAPTPARYSILSPKRLDRIIGGIGVGLILFGVLLFAKVLPFPLLQTYWWIPTSIGIVAFSWLFHL